MNRLNPATSVTRIALSAAVLSAATAPRAVVADTILEVYDDSLTTYVPEDPSAVQDVRPLVDHRGVNIDGALRAGGGPPMSLSGNPFGESWNGNALFSGVRLDTGTYSITDVDLALPAPGFSWVIGRSYNVRQLNEGEYHDSDGYQGVNWFQLSQPEMVLHDDSDNAKDMIYLVYGADRFIEFKRKTGTSTQFKAVNGAAGVMDFQADPEDPDIYIYTDQRGWQHYFHGSDTQTAVADRGRFWKTVAPGPGTSSYVAAVSYLNHPSVPGIIGASDSALRSYDYTYTSGRLTKVEVRVGSPSQIVAEVHYSYYTSGDLELVTTKTPLTEDDDDEIDDKWLIRKKHYRYYTGSYNATTNPGNPHQLKYIIDFEGYRRYDWLDSGLEADSPLSASDEALEPYASAYFEYEDSDYPGGEHRRITKAWFSGSCGCTGGSGGGTYEFSYEKNEEYFDPESGYDEEWLWRAVVTRPDGTYLTQYFDETGQPLSQVVTDGDPAGTPDKTWATYVERDGTGGLLTAIHSPANLDTYTHDDGSQDPEGSFTPKTGSGLVTVFERVDESEDWDGFLEHVKHKEGDSGTAYFDTTLRYTSATETVGNVTRPLIEDHWVYTEPGTTQEATDQSAPAGAYKTSVAYTFHTGVAALTPKQITTMYPAVSTGNLGSGSTTTSSVLYDEAGRPLFEKTVDGIINYWQYRSGDGQLEKMIEDADTASDEVAECYDDTIPSEFQSSGQELHRVTCYSYKGGGVGAIPLPDICNCVLDADGNTSTTGEGPTAVSYTARLADGRFATLAFSDYEHPTSGSDKYYGPVAYTITNHAGGIDVEGVIALDGEQQGGQYTTASPTSFLDETDDDPITAIGAFGDLVQMTTNLYSKTGSRLEASRTYFVIPGSGEGTQQANYDPMLYGYDDLGRTVRAKDPTGTIQRTVYDELGRVLLQWIGTNDNSFAGGEPSGTDDMVKTAAFEYDTGGDNGNSHLTKQTLFVESGTTGQRVTSFAHDLRGRVLLQTNPTEPKYVLSKHDNLGRVIASGQYETGDVTASNDPTQRSEDRLGLSQVSFDELGRVWKIQFHKIDSDGVDQDNLQTLTWRDAAGRTIKVDGTQLTKTFYDRLGRLTHEFVLARDNDSSYGNAADVSGDQVLQEIQTVYRSGALEGLGAFDDVVLRAVIDRYHDADGASGNAGALDTDGDALVYTAADLAGRIQITAYWYDRLGRTTDIVQFGTYDGGDFDRASFVDQGNDVPPTRSDDALRTTHTYDLEGALAQVEDPKGLKTAFRHDPAGRQTEVIRNYVNDQGPSGSDDNQTTRYVYAGGLQTAMIADLPGTSDDQETRYIYGVSKGTNPADSKIGANNLLLAVVYPDSTNSAEDPGDIASDDSDVVTFAYNAQGEEIRRKDQAGNVLATDYDDSGRSLHRRATTIETSEGFDDQVARISATYDTLGRVDKVTQYDDPSPSEGDVVNQVQYGYDDWGLNASFKQDRDSEIDANAYEVSYVHAKATGGRNTLRRTKMILPNLDEAIYDYDSSADNLDDDASRVTGVQVKQGEPTVYVARYGYNGLDQVVGTTYLEPPNYDIQWTLYGSSSGSYPALDSFNRVISCTWSKQLTTPLDFYDVAVSYDRNGNVEATADNVFGQVLDVTYTLDDLNRLTKSLWGDPGAPKLRHLWEDPVPNPGLDQAGNWDHVRLNRNENVDDDFTDAGEYDDDRQHNEANELILRDPDDNTGTTNIDLVYDQVGNLIDDDEYYQYTYDVFGRLREVRDTSDQSLVAEYRYNGLGHRVGWHYDVDADGTVEDTTDDPWNFFAYDERWRVVAMYEEEEESDDQILEQFVYHAAGFDGYGGASSMDTVILRDRDLNGNGTMDERRYYCQNRRGDVVVMLDKDGKIVERATYSAYGTPFGMPRGDTDADGAVNVTDLLNVLSWYDPNPPDVRGDFDLDGLVTVADLLVVLGNYNKTLGWGVLSDIDNRKGYAGYEFDPALSASYSLYHVRRRVLNADLGRWITRDPLGYVDGANLYEYASSNPLATVDPHGTDAGGPGELEPGGGGKRGLTGEVKTVCGPSNPTLPCKLAMTGDCVARSRSGLDCAFICCSRPSGFDLNCLQACAKKFPSPPPPPPAPPPKNCHRDYNICMGRCVPKVSRPAPPFGCWANCTMRWWACMLL